MREAYDTGGSGDKHWPAPGDIAFLSGTSLNKEAHPLDSPFRGPGGLGGDCLNWRQILPPLRLLEGEVSKDLKRVKGEGKERRRRGPWKLTPPNTHPAASSTVPQASTRTCSLETPRALCPCLPVSSGPPGASSAGLSGGAAPSRSAHQQACGSTGGNSSVPVQGSHFPCPQQEGA